MKPLFFLLLFLNSVLSDPSCKIGEHFCQKCNPTTNLCIKCENNNVLIPDEEGGCTGNKKCTVGLNYCEECDEENALCKTCNGGLFPDENGGCTYTENCLFSFLGECLHCAENFILIGENTKLKICKNTLSDDFANCEIIDELNGICEQCKEGYYPGYEDKKCSDTEHCGISAIGKCVKCQEGYYLDHSDERKCKFSFSNEKLFNCLETEDGETCSKCNDNSYFDSEGKCVKLNFCAQSDGYKCQKCIDDYFLTRDGKSCVTTDNCYKGDSDIGICNSCNRYFYLDVNDGQCKSNQEDDDLKFCTRFTDKCESCETNYVFSKDGKCSLTTHCAQIEAGECQECEEDYFLTTNKFCSNIEHCIATKIFGSCEECEDGYFYNVYDGICMEAEGEFEHCKISGFSNVTTCNECKDGFYLSTVDFLCKSNKEEGPFYHCARSNSDETGCMRCDYDYYLNSKDNLCSKVENCAVSESETKCVECDEDYCLNAKEGTCHKTDYIEEENEKIYYKCIKTNGDATACETCMEGYEINGNGICNDIEHCTDKDEEGRCIRCQEEPFPERGYCLNKDFGCVEVFYSDGCLKCDELDYDNCTECEEGYELKKGIYMPGYFSCEKISSE